MKNFVKHVDFDQIKNQVSDLKDQMQDLHFRKPWTRGRDGSPFAFMALGAALAWIGMALYKNRVEVAHFCSNCGAELRNRWQSSDIKGKTERIFGKAAWEVGKAKDKAQEAMGGTGTAKNQEAFYPT